MDGRQGVAGRQGRGAKTWVGLGAADLWTEHQVDDPTRSRRRLAQPQIELEAVGALEAQPGRRRIQRRMVDARVLGHRRRSYPVVDVGAMIH